MYFHAAGLPQRTKKRRPGKAERRSCGKTGTTEKTPWGALPPGQTAALPRVWSVHEAGFRARKKFTGSDANGRQVFRLVGVKARARPAFPFPLEQWQMAGALAHTAAVPHGIDYPFPFSFRQAEHLPFGFI